MEVTIFILLLIAPYIHLWIKSTHHINMDQLPSGRSLIRRYNQLDKWDVVVAVYPMPAARCQDVEVVEDVRPAVVIA